MVAKEEKRNHQGEKGKIKRGGIDVSVVVPSYNPGPRLFKCLHALISQKTRYRYEIILVDSSENDITKEVKAHFPSVQVIHLPQRTYPGTARNIGIQRARGRIIASTDTDCIVAPNWVEQIGRNHDARWELKAIMGSILNGTPSHPVGISEYLLEFNEFLPRRPAQKLSLLATANISFKRDIFRKIGFFEDSIKGSDVLFGHRLFRAGESVFFQASIQVTHYQRIELIKYLRNCFDIGRGASRNRKRYPELPGSFLTRYPFLIPLIPIFRTASITNRLIRYDRRAFLLFVALYPLNLLGLLIYTLGFMRGMFD